MKNLFCEIASVAKIKDFYFFSRDRTSLSKDVVRKRYKAIREMVDLLCYLMVMDNRDYSNLRKEVLSSLFQNEWNLDHDTILFKIMSGVAEAYGNAKTPKQKYIILSVVAETVSYSEISRFLPGLTRYALSRAKKYAI